MNLNAEVIDLASEGYFYSHQSPLAGGTLKILPITAAHEELLANGNLAKRGLLEREFLNSVVEGGVNYDELLHCDKVSILLNLRIANYGSTAKAKTNCAACGEEFEYDLTFAFRGRPFDFSRYQRGRNELSYVFPRCKKTVKFRLGTCAEHEIFAKEGWLAFAKKITNSIEGVEDLEEFYLYQLSAIDSKLFREFYETRTPGYDTTTRMECPSCKASRQSKLDVTHEIFGVTPASRLALHGEIFDLCYYSNGAFTQEGVYNMPTSLRNFYVKRLVDAKKAEADAHKAASEGKQKPTKLAKPPTFNK